MRERASLVSLGRAQSARQHTVRQSKQATKHVPASNRKVNVELVAGITILESVFLV